MASLQNRFKDLFDELSDAFKSVGDHIVFGDPRVNTDLLRGEAIRYFTRLFSVALVSEMEFHDPAYPHFCSYLTPWLNWGYPNPDGTYHWTTLHGDHQYRIWGRRGTARLFDIEIWQGDLADMNGCRVVGGLRHIVSDQAPFQLGPNGEFEVIVSRESQPGDWIPLGEGFGHMYLRQWYYDFDNESPGQVNIERIGASYPAPAPSAESHAARVRLVIDFLRKNPPLLTRGVEQHFAAEPGTVAFPGSLIKMDSGNEISFRNQYYARGVYHCELNEAVILEVEPPEAQYWLFVLMSHFWEHFDWRGRQISINGFEAAIDSDGLFRAVISHRDPGVANWLDTYGHVEGLIGGRYNGTKTRPIPKLTVVPFDKVLEHLPSNTKRVTPEQRHEILRRRLINARRLNLDW